MRYMIEQREDGRWHVTGNGPDNDDRYVFDTMAEMVEWLETLDQS